MVYWFEIGGRKTTETGENINGLFCYMIPRVPSTAFIATTGIRIIYRKNNNKKFVFTSLQSFMKYVIGYCNHTVCSTLLGQYIRRGTRFIYTTATNLIAHYVQYSIVLTLQYLYWIFELIYLFYKWCTHIIGYFGFIYKF